MNPLIFNFNRDEQIAIFVPQAEAGAERPKAAELSQKMFHLYRVRRPIHKHARILVCVACTVGLVLALAWVGFLAGLWGQRTPRSV